MVLLSLSPPARAQQAADNDAPLGLADLAAQRAALSGKFENDEPPRPTTFRELWDHAEADRGRRVIVSGRIVRIFRQDALGGFPPLVEAWIEEPPGNLFCALFEPRADEHVEVGRFVAFTGAYLRRVRYQAGGESRLAPLIVGAEPPRIQKPTPTDKETGDKRPATPAQPWTSPGGSLALLVALAAVAALLARRSLAGSSPRRRRRRRTSDADASADSVPEFLDPEPADGDPH